MSERLGASCTGCGAYSIRTDLLRRCAFCLELRCPTCLPASASTCRPCAAAVRLMDPTS